MQARETDLYTNYSEAILSSVTHHYFQCASEGEDYEKRISMLLKKNIKFSP